MRKFLLLATLLCFSSIYAQNDTWYAFFDQEYNRGFKDADGKVMIAPKFVAATQAVKFEHIMGAMEFINGHYTLYYLLKNGRQFAQDSIYFYDMTFDCESEGLIKFSAKSGVGMFNSEGRIAIPALYNELESCRNGYIVARKGAEKKWEGEHYFWEGGTISLIDRNNKTVISDFKEPNKYNLYSVRITDEPVNDPIRVTFKGTDGKYYSFIDNDKEFRQFINGFLSNLTPEKLTANTFDVFVYQKGHKERTWIKKEGEECPQAKAIIEGITAINKLDIQYYIGFGDILVSDKAIHYFDTLYDNCGNYNSEKYPSRSITITYVLKDRHGKPVIASPDAAVTTAEGYEYYTEQFTFLRTEKGYKLISARLK